ncbi:hypothetical protein EBU99_02545 [bacterium]|nr:hypothetical protein [bacterium]
MSRLRINLTMLMVVVFPATISCIKKSGPMIGGFVPASLANQPRDYVRSSMAISNDSSHAESADLNTLLGNRNIVVPSPQNEFSADKSVFSSLMSSAQYGFNMQPESDGKGGFIRREAFTIVNRLSPRPIRLSDKILPFHLDLAAQSSVEIYRHFQNQDEANRVPPVSFLDLPLTIENARKMRTGDLVVIPIEAQVMTAIDGSFLRGAFQAGRDIESFLGNSLIGHSQTGLRANLLVNGRFEMHIFKVDGNYLRVRFFEQSERSANVGANATASFSTRYTLIPLSTLQQVSELKKIANARFSGNSSGGLQLRGPLRGLESSSAITISDQEQQANLLFDADMRKRDDGLLSLVNQVSLKPEELQDTTTNAMTAMLKKLSEDEIRKIKQPSAKSFQFTDQELRFDASVSWNEARTGRRQFFTDFQFDLRNELAQEAYLQAVSGRAVLLSSRNDLGRFFQNSRTLHNFTLAERLARETSDQKNPPVVRLLSASARSSIAESNFQIKLVPRAGFSLSENWFRESYRVSSSDNVARPSNDGFFTRWSFQQASWFGIVSDRNARSSGFVSDISARTGKQSLYWYSQELEGSSPSGSHLEQFINQAYNVLGPVASGLSLSKQYRGEVEGGFRGRLVLGIAPALLDRLFDNRTTSEAVVWSAVAKVTSTFDNTFGLPYLVIPAGVPAALAGTSYQSSCQTIISSWGSFYCHYIANEVLPRLIQAQRNPTAEAKAEFLESFFGTGFGANKIGAELLARILLQSALEQGTRLDPNDLAVLIDSRHQKSSAPDYNPKVKYGSSELLTLLEQTLPVW